MSPIRRRENQLIAKQTRGYKAYKLLTIRRTVYLSTLSVSTSKLSTIYLSGYLWLTSICRPFSNYLTYLVLGLLWKRILFGSDPVPLYPGHYVSLLSTDNIHTHLHIPTLSIYLHIFYIAYRRVPADLMLALLARPPHIVLIPASSAGSLYGIGRTTLPYSQSGPP